MDGLAGVAAAIDALADVDVAVRDTVALGSDLIELTALIARLEAEALRRLAAFDVRGGAEVDAAGSTTSWLRAQCRIAPGPARSRVLLARALDRTLPATRAALTAGDITLPHAHVIARAVEDLPAEVVPAAEAALLTAAELTDPATLRREVARIRHAHAPDRLPRDEAELHDQRRLHVSPTLDGMVAIDGLLDPESGAVLTTALNALTTPAPDDDRTPAQRRADALTELARRSLDAGDLPSAGGERPHVTIITDLPALLGGADTPPAKLVGAGPISLAALLRLTCDPAIVRAVTAGPSELIDLGRRTRLVTTAQRRALDLRDGGCVFPGCDRPPSWCEAHHLVPWARGGPTDLSNLALVCPYHHHAVHDRGWTLTRRPDGAWYAEPPPRDQLAA